MIAGGVILLIFAFLLLIYGCFCDDEVGGKTLCAIGGFVMVFGLNCLLPPFKDRTDEDFTVKTKNKVEIKKEVFIDKDNNSDTTYYYMFSKSSVIDTK